VNAGASLFMRDPSGTWPLADDLAESPRGWSTAQPSRGFVGDTTPEDYSFRLLIASSNRSIAISAVRVSWISPSAFLTRRAI